MRWKRVCVFVPMVALCASAEALAQGSAAPQPHQHPPAAASPDSWRFMQDGVIYGMFNRQGGARGGREFAVPNWWMGMMTRERGTQQLGLTAMLSLDPATLGKDGYRELFQVGETLDGKPLVDRQHPHEFLMQLAGSWRMQPREAMSLTLAAGLAGEPTLGPVAFMHRPSAAGVPLAPLGHHTFDSTHISFGVVTASATVGRWVIEGSAFNAREPDEERWDLDLARLDSAAGRIWFRPTDEWDIQASVGRLREPEALEPGDATRATASAAWFRSSMDGFQALTIGYGVNAAHGVRRHGVFGEFTRELGDNSLAGRVELQQVETSALIGEEEGHEHGHADERARVAALTVGGARRLATWRGFEAAAGANVSFYRVPELLKETHGRRPVSFLVFLRLRLPTGSMGRMWNMRMSQGHVMASGHAGHQMSPTAFPVDTRGSR